MLYLLVKDSDIGFTDRYAHFEPITLSRGPGAPDVSFSVENRWRSSSIVNFGKINNFVRLRKLSFGNYK